MPLEREAARQVHLAVGMPANERMDWLVEKATELGVAGIQPLVAERSVLKLNGERAQKKRAHWQGIAIAACEQCGRNRVPADPRGHGHGALAGHAPGPGAAVGAVAVSAARGHLMQAAAGVAPLLVLSGPEGGLTAQEEQAALAQGFQPASLGARVLRAETAPLAVLAALTLGR